MYSMKQHKKIKKELQPTVPFQQTGTNRLYIGLIICIVVWGIFLRSVELFNGNFLFGLDHGRDFLAAYNIVENHKLTLIGAEAGSGVAGINGIFHGPGYFYLIALSYILFGGNPIGAEVFMVLFGVLAILFSIKFGYELCGKVGAVLATFFVTVSPLIVSQSRFIWSSHPITIFVLLSIYCVYQIPKKPILFAPLAVFLAGFTYHSQLGVAVPLTVSVLLAIPLVYRISDWKVYAWSFFALIIAYSPMAFFELRHNFMAVRSAISYVTIGDSTGVHTPILDPLRLANHTFDYWNNFYNTFTYEFGWIPWAKQMVVLKIILPIVGLGALLVKEKKQRQFLWFILLMTVTTWAGFLLLNNTVWDYYLTHTRIGYILFFVICMTALWRQRKQSIIKNVGVLLCAVFIATVAFGSVFRQYVSYTIDIKDTNVIDKVRAKKAVIDMMYTDAAGQPFSEFIFVPPIYTYAYDYLFMTYGKKRYGYVPGKEKHGIAYLLIEPDNGQPWRQKGWLETVVQGGETVWKKTIYNGIILEKRVYP